jgi:hypothetical protein
MSRYQVTRSYIACAVYEVDADTEIEATRLAMQGEGYVKTYDGDWDEAVTTEQLEE